MNIRGAFNYSTSAVPKVAAIVEELARDRGEDVALAAAHTTQTAAAFFRLPD